MLHNLVIVDFSDKATESLFLGETPKRFPADVRKRMIQKLQMLHATVRLEDLRVPAGNRLEALMGNRRGYHSIRINDQWRLCFIWDGVDAHDVEIIDYH